MKNWSKPKIAKPAKPSGRVMAFRQRIGKLGGRKPKRNHESQVEQKFEWSREAVQLLWIAPAHLSRVMVQGVGTGRHLHREAEGLGEIRIPPCRYWDHSMEPLHELRVRIDY